MAQYKVRRDKLDLVNQAIVHFMSFPDETAEKNRQTTEYTEKFVEVLYPKREEKKYVLSHIR